jgi:hypothetical protein
VPLEVAPNSLNLKNSPGVTCAAVPDRDIFNQLLRFWMNQITRSTMRQPHFYGAVYLILRNANKVLMMSRANTGWMDGHFSLPAGHMKAVRSC